MFASIDSLHSHISGGEVTPNEAQVVSSVIEVYRKVIETTELESRITELEKVSNE